MKLDIPGPGGSLGECPLCGECFAAEIMLGKTIKMVSMDGFDTGLPMHDKCVELLEGLRGSEWTALPDGPLRKEYAKAFVTQTN